MARLFGGLLLITAAASSADIHYVNLNNPAPAAPYTSWATAALAIQDAVDGATNGDQILVTNGVYTTGGRAIYGLMTNRVAIDKAVTVSSVNGPLVTLIQGQPAPGATNGDGAIRCVYVGTNAVLSGFTLTNGHTRAAVDDFREQSGGGAWCEISAVLTNCILSGNSAFYGGGADSGTLNNCTLSGNSAFYGGGGADFGTLNNCTLSGNSASYGGGGASYGTLNNCTLSGNSASGGGGAYYVTLNNCTLSGNSASFGGGAYHGTLNNCTLSDNSASDSGGGAYEGTLNNCTLSGNSASSYGGGAAGCALDRCTLSGNSANYGGGAWLSALYNGVLSGNAANDGGGAYYGTLNNSTLTANIATNAGGGAYSGTLNSCALTANIATNAGGGAYAGTLSTCALLDNSAYDGGGAYNATITSSLLTSNSASWGGGASMSTLTRCILIGNSAYSGGGADDSTLITCLLVSNTASLDGGAADYSSVLSCTFVGNTAGRYGGGASSSTVSNSIVVYNSAPQGSNYSPGNTTRTLNYCCTSPMPANGIGNIAMDPRFLDSAAGNFRLGSNSPCINFGNNSSYNSLETTDLDGRPRPVGYIADIGAYEFNPIVSGFFIAWLQSFGLPTDGSVDFTDPNHNGLNNYQEWLASSNPTSAPTVLRMLSAKPVGPDVLVSWQSASGAVYTVEYATNLAQVPSFRVLAANIPGQADATTFRHTNAAAARAAFYRVCSP